MQGVVRGEQRSKRTLVRPSLFVQLHTLWCVCMCVCVCARVVCVCVVCVCVCVYVVCVCVCGVCVCARYAVSVCASVAYEAHEQADTLTHVCGYTVHSYRHRLQPHTVHRQ